MKKLALLALVLGFSSISMAGVSATVYLPDGNTPLEWADPNVPYVYRDIMVGTKLTIIVSSDTDESWSGGLQVTGPDVGYGVLSARDYDDVTRYWEGSVLEAAGDGAEVRVHEDSFNVSIGMFNGQNPVPGDWFIVDYNATTLGLRTIGLYERRWEADGTSGPFNPPVPIVVEISELVFSHVPSRDFNGDTKVDFTDFAIISAFRGMTDCAGPNWCEGTDLDADGDVDVDDFMLFFDYWLEITQ